MLYKEFEIVQEELDKELDKDDYSSEVYDTLKIKISELLSDTDLLSVYSNAINIKHIDKLVNIFEEMRVLASHAQYWFNKSVNKES